MKSRVGYDSSRIGYIVEYENRDGFFRSCHIYRSNRTNLWLIDETDMWGNVVSRYEV